MSDNCGNRLAAKLGLAIGIVAAQKEHEFFTTKAVRGDAGKLIAQGLIILFAAIFYGLRAGK